MNSNPSPPVVLCLSGLDPSGGAGIQADIEAIAANGAFCAPLVSCLTIQDSRQVFDLAPIPANVLKRQIASVLADYQIAAIKIGLLGSLEIAQILAATLVDYPDIPVILDPVLAATGGGAEASQDLCRYLANELLPHTTLVTPNRREARLLSGCDDSDEAARFILDRGCKAVLITGADEAENGQVLNVLVQGGVRREWLWPRLAGSFHGSGCTLASAAAALIARGVSLEQAAEQAQTYTWHTLQRAFLPGKGQLIPRRLAPCDP